jgi:Sap, sulfolipid-1-addressing protein
MGGAFAFAFSAALNPTLLTATMVMLFASEPKRLMSGYLLGAYAVSIGLGLVIVFALQDSSAVSTTQHTLSPAADIVLGLLFMLAAFAIRSDRDARLQTRRRARAEARGPKAAPRWRKALDKGSPRTTFAVGVLLTLPGASYIAGMVRISKSHVSTIEAALAVVIFCVIMLILIELPLLGLAISPDFTKREIGRFTEWVSTSTRMIITRALLVLGSLLLLRAAITLLS